MRIECIFFLLCVFTGTKPFFKMLSRFSIRVKWISLSMPRRSRCFLIWESSKGIVIKNTSPHTVLIMPYTEMNPATIHSKDIQVASSKLVHRSRIALFFLSPTHLLIMQSATRACTACWKDWAAVGTFLFIGLPWPFVGWDGRLVWVSFPKQDVHQRFLRWFLNVENCIQNTVVIFLFHIKSSLFFYTTMLLHLIR